MIQLAHEAAGLFVLSRHLGAKIKPALRGERVGDKSLEALWLQFQFADNVAHIWYASYHHLDTKPTS